MTKLTEFWDNLNSHDWYYAFSDDGRVWRAGDAAEKRLEEIAKESPKHRELLEAFSNHHFSGEPWNTPKAPKPERLV